MGRTTIAGEESAKISLRDIYGSSCGLQSLHGALARKTMWSVPPRFPLLSCLLSSIYFCLYFPIDHLDFHFTLILLNRSIID